MCNFTYIIEITKEEVENATLFLGEYIITKDGKYYLAHGVLLDGYVCPCQFKGEEICLDEEVIGRLLGRSSKPK